MISGHKSADQIIRDRLIVALDVKSREEAREIVKVLGKTVSFYKIGGQFAYSGGIEFIKELYEDGRKVFLDMKIWDVSATVEGAVEGIIAGGNVSYLTIHSYRRGIEAAVKAAAAHTEKPKILCVTVLTSMDKQDMIDEGYAQDVEVRDIVLNRARVAKQLGADGVISSGLEAKAIRDELGRGFTIITPGIRLPGNALDDQKRVATPFEAISNGADFVVVGRPIIRAKDRKGEAERVLEQIQAAAEKTQTQDGGDGTFFIFCFRFGPLLTSPLPIALPRPTNWMRQPKA